MIDSHALWISLWFITRPLTMLLNWCLHSRTSVYKPISHFRIRECATIFGVRHWISISSKYWNHSLSLRSIVLKTSFYQPTEVALSFRLAPDFLPENEYPKKPSGMFFVIGNEFRGFHICFRDVARSDIRIVIIRNRENCAINQRMTFEENYGWCRPSCWKIRIFPRVAQKERFCLSPNVFRKIRRLHRRSPPSRLTCWCPEEGALRP